MSGKLDWNEAQKRDLVRSRGAEPVAKQKFRSPTWINREQREQLLDHGFPADILTTQSFTGAQANRLLRTLRTIPVKLSDIRAGGDLEPEARGKELLLMSTRFEEKRPNCIEMISHIGRGAGAVPHAKPWLRYAVDNLESALDRALLNTASGRPQNAE